MKEIAYAFRRGDLLNKKMFIQQTAVSVLNRLISPISHMGDDTEPYKKAVMRSRELAEALWN